MEERFISANLFEEIKNTFSNKILTLTNVDLLDVFHNLCECYTLFDLFNCEAMLNKSPLFGNSR